MVSGDEFLGLYPLESEARIVKADMHTQIQLGLRQEGTRAKERTSCPDTWQDRNGDFPDGSSEVLALSPAVPYLG